MVNRWIMIILCACSLPVFAEEAEAKAEEKPYSSLLDNSPFLTPSFKARLGQHDSTTLSFIGYTKVGETWHFALIDKKGGQTHWLKMNEEVQGIKVESFNEQSQQLHLTVGGIGFDLVLLEAKAGSTLLGNPAATGATSQKSGYQRNGAAGRTSQARTANNKTNPNKRSGQNKTAQNKSKNTPFKKKK